jgi:hypothetical protein
MSTWREVLVEVTADALEATRRELAARTHAIVGRLRPVITAAFRATREYGELADGGKLRVEFGLRSGKLAADGVAEAVAAAAGFEVQKDGAVLFYAVAEDFSDALAARSAWYFSVNRRGQSRPVDWFKWYLGITGQPVAPGYGLSLRGSPRARAEDRFMLRVGGKIQQYAPTDGSDWMRRVADIATPEFVKLLEAEAGRLAAGG